MNIIINHQPGFLIMQVDMILMKEQVPKFLLVSMQHIQKKILRQKVVTTGRVHWLKPHL